jgi:hypothetical protein
MEHTEPTRVPISDGIDPPHIETLMFPERFWAAADRPATERIELLKHNAEVAVRCRDRLGFFIVDTGLSAPSDWSAHLLTEREAKKLRQETGLFYTPGTFVDEWRRGRVFDPICKTWIQQYGTLKSIDEWEEWAETFPDPWAEGRDVAASIVITLAKQREIAVCGIIRSPFASLFEAFPIEIYYRLQLEHPAFIKKAVKAYTDYNCEEIKRLGELGCDSIRSHGDIAHRDGPHMRPSIFHEIFFPEMRRQVEATHKAGMKFIKHSDGNINRLIDGLVNIARIDGLHSLDPSAGIDIGAIKEQWGDRIFLQGNVAVDSLALKSEAEVITETRECIRKAAPGGGYMLNSSNSWYAHCKLRNCLAMVRVGLEHGKYPIQI